MMFVYVCANVQSLLDIIFTPEFQVYMQYSVTAFPHLLELHLLILLNRGVVVKHRERLLYRMCVVCVKAVL